MLIITERTKKGKPALFENGGAYQYNGKSRIICNSQGLPKRPLFVRTQSKIFNGEQALIPLSEGDFIIFTDWKVLMGKPIRETITVHQIVCFLYKKQPHGINVMLEDLEDTEINDEKTLICAETKIWMKSKGTWNVAPPDHIQKAIDIAVIKANTYHCMEAMYVDLTSFKSSNKQNPKNNLKTKQFNPKQNEQTN